MECFETLKSKPIEFSETISIGISGHSMEQLLLIKMEKLLGHAYFGMIPALIRNVLNLKIKIDVRSISGNIAMPGFTAPKINWIKKYGIFKNF